MHEDLQGQVASEPSRLNSAAPATTRWQVSMEQLWLLFPIFLLIYKGFIFPLPPLDFWWHLKMGEVISTTGSIPAADLFSFTAAGRPFTLQNWLGELIYYWTYQLGGFPLLVFLGTLLTVVAFLLMYRLCLDATPYRRVAALVGFLACLANYGFLRPQTYSFLLFSAFYLILSRYRQRGTNHLWLMPVLMALWVNLHGAFVIGLALVALYIGCESLRRMIDPQRTDALSVAQLRTLTLVFAVCCLATLINPEGYRIYDYVRAVILDAGSQQLVAEWQPPRPNDLLGFLLFYCPFLLAILVFIQTRVKPDLTEMALFFTFAFLGLSAIRNAAWFGTITFPLIARYLPLVDLSPLLSLRRFRVVHQFSQPASGGEDGPAYGRMNLALLGIASLILVSQSPWVRPAITGKSLLAEQTPVGAADFIEKQGISGRLFHPQEFGDYLMWRLWPQQKTVVDGRVHLFELDFLRQYKNALEHPLESDFLERWKIEYLLLSKLPDGSSSKTIDSVRNSETWTQIYEDRVSVLFEKRSR